MSWVGRLVLLRENRPEDAAPYLKRALESDPERPEPWSLTDLVSVRMGDDNTAENAFREAIRIEPDSTDAHNHLAICLPAAAISAELNGCSRRRSRAILRDQRQHGAILRIFLRHPAILLKQNAYREALAIDSSLPQAHLAPGMLLMRPGRAKDTRTHLQSATAKGDFEVRTAALSAPGK